MILFDNFKQLLQLVLSNSQTVGQNAVLSDATYSKSLSDHITALTPDQNIRLNTTNVELASGLLVSDTNRREIRFEPKGSGKIVQGFLEANISDVRKIWQRSDDALGTATTVPYGTLADGRRYYVTDNVAGVFYLNEYGHILGAVPGLGDILTGYGANPVSSITFSVAGIEYIAILAAEHFLRVYLSSDFSLVATFGTPNTPGLPDLLLLDTPTDLAFDPATSTLYVACAGTAGPSVPAGATGPGIVFSLDASALPALTFGAYLAQDGKSLHQGQVVLPSGLSFDTATNSLWILNGDVSNTARPFEIGGLSVTGTVGNGYLNGYLEFSGLGFSTVAASKIHVDIDRRRLYLTNSPSVEVFDLVTLKHLYTFGYYGVDTSSSNPSSPKFLPVTGQVSAVASDILSVDGVQVNFALFNDATNNRLVRVGENLYEGSNVVTFVSETFVVPLRLHGYLVKGTLASDKVQVEYRTSATGNWQLLSQTDSVPASAFFQFQLKVVADLQDVIQNSTITEVIVIGEQE